MLITQCGYFLHISTRFLPAHGSTISLWYIYIQVEEKGYEKKVHLFLHCLHHL